MQQARYYPDLEIGLYRPGEEEAILDCMRVCFGDEQDIESWRHIHLENPSGKATIVLARDRGVVLSYMVLVPRRIEAFGHEGLAGHHLWTMNRPAWQGRGLSRTLGAKI
jgi:hypothetical protein